jgi:hypothetical protein
MTKLKIDKTLAAYLGPASKFADAELERQLIAEGGPREPVYVWNGTIIDGHRRYLVCEKHKLPYKIVEVDLPDRDAVREWMDRHQFCRRNVSQNEEYRHIARLVAGKAAETGSKSEAVKAVAEEIGKTERQVWRDVVADEQYTEDVEALDPVVKQAIEDSGERLSKNALHSLATLEPEHQKRVAAEVELGEFSSFREAILGKKEGKKHAEKKPQSGKSDVRDQIGIWQDAVRRWMSGSPSIDRYRELHPGPLGDRVIDAAKELYEALGAWKKGIK